MFVKIKNSIAGIVCGLVLYGSVSAQTKPIVIDATRSVARVQPTMWGIFFEDINFGADGGLYAELIKNRSFEFPDPWMGWKKMGKANKEGVLLLENRARENPNNPRYIRVSPVKTAAGDLGFSNEGFRGMGFRKGASYDFSVLYRTVSAHRRMVIELKDAENQRVGMASLDLPDTDGQWNKASVSVASTETVLKGHADFWIEGSGAIDLDMLSLFPKDTWKKRPGGLRADMVQRLADLQPGFIRFPGGCIVEGRDLSNRYEWKTTVGPVEDRKLIMNRWNVEFPHRATPDYYQSYGLGFYEYFLLAEDIGAEPLPILNCGMACQFNTAEVQALQELDPYVQDALDLIEFANGNADTHWGKVRVQMGHPAPFHLKMMGIGNENWGPQYVERLRIFKESIHARYPDIKIVGSSGTDPDGERYRLLNDSLRQMGLDFIDEHYYRSPDWFLKNAERYDHYPRTGSKVFAGEYASHSGQQADSLLRNNWEAALSEAAFMTGLERNADVVEMASYAPLFAHMDAWQWAPDLIWVNNLTTVATPDYYVQQLYSKNKGTEVIAATQEGKALTGQDLLYLSAVRDTNKKEVIVKIVNTAAAAQDLQLIIKNREKLKSARRVTLSGSRPESVNSFSDPDNIVPQEGPLSVVKNQIAFHAAPRTFYVLKISY